MNVEVAWAVVVPLAGALLSSFAGQRIVHGLSWVTTLGTAGAALSVSWSVARRGPLQHAVGGWLPPLGIQLRADGLAAMLLATLAVVGALLSVHAIRDRETTRQRARSFFSLWFFAWGALNALVLSADIFNLYVTLELTTLASVGLIAIRGGRDALRASLRYLLIALSGSLVYLLGVAITYGVHASLDLTELGARANSSSASWVAFSLMTLGLSLKTALFPLHGWLPPVYVSARPVVAAFLSSLIGKGSFVVLLRLWFEVFPAGFELVAGRYLGVLGGAGVLWGSLLALRQERLKPLIAYSSVAQIGYLFLLFPLSTPGAWLGGVYLMISHAAAKASMFLAAATIERAIGRDDLDGLRGLSRHLPVTFFTLALAGISLMGMPPSGGFIAKWLLVRAAIEAGQWWWALVILVGGLLGAGYVFRILRRAFLPLPPEAEARAIPRRDELPALALALVALLLGLVPDAVLSLLDVAERS